MRSSHTTLYISRPPTLPALQSEPWQHAPAPSIIPPLTWPLPQELRPSCPPPEEQEEGEEDDNDEEGEEEDDGEEEGEDDGDEGGEEEDNGEEGEEEDDDEEGREEDDGEEEDEDDNVFIVLEEEGLPVHPEPAGGADLEDYPDTANFGVQVIEYDEVEREDHTSGGQPTKCEDYPDTANFGVQVIEYDEVERETFDGQDYPDATDYGQPIDYPDTTDYGVQDDIYEGGLDYGYGDEEQGWEENAGFDSY